MNKAMITTGFILQNTYNNFKNIKIYSKGFEADHEITVNLLKQNYNIKEVGINYYPRSKKEGKKINSLDALKALLTIIKFKFTN